MPTDVRVLANKFYFLNFFTIFITKPLSFLFDENNLSYFLRYLLYLHMGYLIKPTTIKCEWNVFSHFFSGTHFLYKFTLRKIYFTFSSSSTFWTRSDLYFILTELYTLNAGIWVSTFRAWGQSCKEWRRKVKSSFEMFFVNI